MDILNFEIIDSAYAWLISHGLKIVGILAAAYILKKFGFAFIGRLVRKIAGKSGLLLSLEAEKQREDTLIKVFNTTLGVALWVVAGMMILSELGINIGPLLAAAGVAGLAFGFGGQYLIRDVISGLFIIFENQYRVGDVLCAAGKCGLVEDINLRLTVLRDLDGTVHNIPNGEIHVASNLTKNYSRVNLNIGVAYDSDLEKVIEVVNKVGKELAEDPKWKEHILKAPEFLRVDDFGDSAIIIKILGDTKPIQQWGVMGELRKRLKIAFDKEGIVIPFPQRVFHQAKNG
ncbi:MAG: potassium transporter KefA [Candidatus Taylorbacteria bacterium RIFCSPLOWO2_12_FULL_43_20]|uniref:Potassium transporter KefA n=1 Tax=Candidatus Taylorbacteria bacterium RIFCSPLOWO2_12_FULL_43_20 TaxID=1802332 RepID=A0A1G2P5A4_9BACT|nr:MAG: potassium transporter KefA [Candidatus Taylorbacteria bacterium RIFCSPHIGHO2_01_FULL_43_120]OHA22076.1 MAG: potassium transporter KefA [Candidatus Taylorbacteria bacterium RIFCSPHIGHO2_02_FULL_43_55]OHA28179.1 MAG: potassium transporter KefA [Candidatus Taylorbacteria bacterium RIFCSPHIGHO2_12_FULL_42_34]OHA31049.1 MAG: potassium transporter KefA [Candidatus Taylorbacteria bacterium RIFCSPLOWO2_01_FULL_43_83]OHA39715.1 MAG: potassium transporter KefA [Candidatus Taylorbacteria bacterium